MPLAGQLVFLGHRLSHLLERRLARHGYNRTQAAVIMFLHRRPGLTANDLAGPARVKPPNVTRALQALVVRGLVSRAPHPTDGRAHVLYLTPEGQQAVATIGELYREVSAELEAALPAEKVESLRQDTRLLLSAVDRLLRGTEA